MSHKKFLPLGMMPVMAMMMVSPMKMTNSSMPYRGIAAEEARPEGGARPDMQAKKEELAKKVEASSRYSAVADKYNKENPHKENTELKRDQYVKNLRGLYDLVEDESKTIDNELKDASKLKDARIRVEGEVAAFATAENDLKDLKDKKLLSDKDAEAVARVIQSSKDKLEELLKKTEEQKGEEVVALNVDDKKVEDKKPEAKKEEDAAVVAKEDKKEDKPAKKAAPTKEDNTLVQAICEQNKLISESMQKLMEQQSTIIQSMMGMMQQMMGQQQAQSYLANQNNLYQYNPQPMPSGSWIFQPNGYQSGQSSFGMPMYQANQSLYNGPQMYNAGMGQMGQNQSAASSGSWGLRPDQSFQLDPRFSSSMQNITPGNFGGNSSSSNSLGNFGMNMNPGMMSPMPQMQMQQSQQPQMQTVPFNLPSTSPSFGGPMSWT